MYRELKCVINVVTFHDSLLFFRDISCSYNIAANERTNVDVSSRVGYDPTNEDVLRDIWTDLQEDGALDPPFCKYIQK